MAKGKKSWTIKAEVHTLTPFSRDPAQRLRAKPKRVQRARSKHKSNSEKEDVQSLTDGQPGFMDRFFALPPELRNHVYRQLLVRPCKFDITHGEDCQPLFPYHPGPDYGNYLVGGICAASCSTTEWRRDHEPCIFVSPARSQWAPAPINEYVCDKCNSERFRAKVEAHPSLSSLLCLCARRQNLEVLLINRRWHREARYIFWSENRFAFETAELLIGFLSSLRDEVRSLITRISFIPRYEPDDPPPAARLLLPCWGLLRKCEGLTHLELDSMFLSRFANVRGLRDVRVKQGVTFIAWDESHSEERLSMYPNIDVWKTLRTRTPVEDHSVADALAAAMTAKGPPPVKILKQVFIQYRHGRIRRVENG